MNPTEGDDNLVGTTGADSVNALGGNDTINLLTRPAVEFGPIDIIDGGLGIDTVIFDCSAETQSVQLGVGGSPIFTLRSTSGNFYVDAYAVELVKFTGGSGDDIINTGDHGGTVNGSGGIDHWLANLGALTSAITFTLGTTTSIGAAGLTSILNVERLSLTTGTGNDVITGGAQADSVSTGEGDDTINLKTRPSAGVAIDVADGGIGTDTLVVDASAETQAVQLGVGGSPNFLVRSDSGNFYIDAYNMEVIKIATGSANDTINTGTRGGTIDGNAGIDYWLADLSALTTGVTFILGTTTAIAAAGLTSILDVERISLYTGSGNDVITGGAQADFIHTGAGNDTINAKSRPSVSGGPVDTVDGGLDTDTLIVDASAETQAVQLFFGGSPNFQVRSDSGNFYVDAYNIELIQIATGAGNDTINTGNRGGTVDGNGGVDYWLADLSGLSAGVTFTLGTTTSIAAAGLTSILDLERISLYTGTGNDVIAGGAQADFIHTGAGNDSINAKSRPSVSGGPVDTVDGAADFDTLIVDASAETQAVQLSFGGSPTFAVRSTSGNFYVDAYNMEAIQIATGAGNDSINTGTRGGTIDGNAGIDYWQADLSGLTTGITFILGTTTAIAAAGLTSILDLERISLYTGSGNDVITGGAQADFVDTGAGNDTINLKSRPSAEAPIDVANGGADFDTLVVDASAETQAVQLFYGGSPTFAVRSTSGNFYTDAFNMEAIKITTGAGNDTLDTGTRGGTVNGGAGIDYWLTDLSAVNSGVSFTLGTTTAIAAAGLTSILGIEQIWISTGSGSDNIVGGAQADTINTGAGNDTINAGARPFNAAPVDVVDGGANHDILVVNAAAETTGVQVFFGGSPNFAVRSTSGNFYVDAYNMEQLNFTGGAGNDTVTGGSVADTLNGNGGDDTLDGGAGADTMNGGAGSDTYYVDNAGDTITEGNVAGIDTVITALAFSLGTQYIENLTLTGSANINLTGNALANVLIGNSGNNTLNGLAGADTMQGGGGNDLYGVENAGDVVDESVGGSGGIDSVNATVSVDLAAGVNFKGNIENVTLLGAANINVTGNGLANTLIGNSGINLINGGGNADIMRGLGGDDTYTVDNAGDVVDESVGGSGGTDTVQASITISLADAVHVKGSVENATLLGTASLNVTGNALANVLIGNSGANTLNGLAGSDTMFGAGGNDLYGVDNIGDVVDESVAGSGVDKINSVVNISLVTVAGAALGKGNIEAITLLGAANIFAYGNALGNSIVGNAGANTLAGGLGNDTMTGGGANDTFVFNTALNATTNVDTITDMNEAGNDTINLENAVFAGLAAGALAAGAFRISTTGAVDADDRIVYNNLTGELFFDSNGNGAGGSVKFAQLDAGLALTAADFFVV